MTEVDCFGDDAINLGESESPQVLLNHSSLTAGTRLCLIKLDLTNGRRQEIHEELWIEPNRPKNSDTTIDGKIIIQIKQDRLADASASIQR